MSNGFDTTERVAVLVNPTANKGQALHTLAEVEQRLVDRQVTFEVLREDSAAKNQAALSAAVSAGVSRVLCVGGDGLVNLAIQELADTGVIIGVVGGGTGNDFARALGLPRTTVEAVDTALEAPMPVDAIWSPHGWAATIVTQGFSVTTNQVANTLPWPTDGRRYVVATGLALPRLRTARTVIEVDDKAFDCDVTILVVGNTRYFGSGTPICPDADPTDGLLDVVAIGPLTRRDLVSFYDTVPDRSFLDNPAVQTFRGANVTITGGATSIWADGEPLGPDELPNGVVFEARPGALLVAGATASG